ncbi:MAG TPA: N-6 DNA methylase [Stellaceae bacterium]|nr:N-6 DNA methylase [Stellaceae bacterium]
MWKEQKTRVDRYGIEASLEQAFIQPVFRLLGWKLKYQTFLQGREPDYALFLDDEALDAALAEGHSAPGFWRHASVVADAKAWHVSLDRPSRTGSQREYPPEQIEWYLDRSRLDFGILTNGKLWRLVPRELEPGKPRFKTYLEVDLSQLLEKLAQPTQLTIDAHELDDLRRFVLFFGPVGFSPVGVAQPLVIRAVKGSAEYAVGIGDNLKDRVFDALTVSIDGLLTVANNNLHPATDLGLCKEQSLILLYRLLFIMFAEDRSLLPYPTNRVYTRNRSLARRRDEIAARLDTASYNVEEDFSPDNFDLWEDLCDLFDLIDRGHGTYGVPAYNGGLFNPDKNSFLVNKKISDWHIARVVDLLGRAPDRTHPKQGLFRIDYRDLAVQQLGGVYEGLLELVPNFASENMITIRERGANGKSELVRPAGIPLPQGYEPTNRYYPKGHVYLVTDKGERRSYGSYYTPDHIVSYIVENTLAPLCAEISERLRQEIQGAEVELDAALPNQKPAMAAKLQMLQGDFGNRVLKLRVLDPAMGSGHFLVRACQYLAEEIATNPNTGDLELPGAASDESSLTYWKRRVVEACIFGVDLNAMAVELAKLALWLDTVSSDHPLSFLDLHLLPGNSLVGARLAELGSLPDAPPIFENRFGAEFRERLPAIIRTLLDIQQMPSDTTAQVKEKDRLLRTHFRPLLAGFQTVADLWCSFFFHSGPHRVTPELYDAAVQRLGNRAGVRLFIDAAELSGAVSSVHQSGIDCFHWELEFPDIFDPDAAGPGFDAVIGNPPYDVLSEKELGRDLSRLRAYLGSRPTYVPSRRGKNNLYKLFICRFIELLRDGGRLGVIVPMALLGDDISALVRRMLLEQGTFTKIDVFPQKDDPKKRVFRDAKLSTSVIHFNKTTDFVKRSKAFTTHIHPADKNEPSSPSLTLTAGEIPLYDPSNLTIVSCSQVDWDLATRIMETGRLVRLREYVEFFQGEVNETNQRQAGNLCGPNEGQLVIRGANVCLYVTRPAS